MEYLLRHNGALDFPVYPGHPMTLAVQIARAFESLEAAHAWTGDCPAALASGDVAGAGGSVYSALQALDKLRAGVPLDDVLTWADGCREYPYRAEWPEACAQARRYLASTDLLAWTRAAIARAGEKEGMSKHTPGPWCEFAESGDWWIQQADADGSPVGDPICGTTGTDGADVLLICAAPDLLAACEAYVAAHKLKNAAEYVRALDAVNQQIRAAIARARGEGGQDVI